VNLTQNIYFSFASVTKVRVLCYVNMTVTTKFYRLKPCTAYIMMVVNARCWVL